MLGAIGRSGTQGSNLAIPPYQSGPFNQLGRARKAEDEGVEPHGREGRHGYSKPVAAPAAHLPFISTRRAADSNRNADTPIRFRGGACIPGRFTLHEQTAPPPGVNRREMAEDGVFEPHPAKGRPVSGRGQPPGWFILRGRRPTRTARCYPRIR